MRQKSVPPVKSRSFLHCEYWRFLKSQSLTNLVSMGPSKGPFIKSAIRKGYFHESASSKVGSRKMDGRPSSRCLPGYHLGGRGAILRSGSRRPTSTTDSAGNSAQSRAKDANKFCPGRAKSRPECRKYLLNHNYSRAFVSESIFQRSLSSAIFRRRGCSAPPTARAQSSGSGLGRHRFTRWLHPDGKSRGRRSSNGQSGAFDRGDRVHGQGGRHRSSQRRGGAEDQRR